MSVKQGTCEAFCEVVGHVDLSIDPFEVHKIALDPFTKQEITKLVFEDCHRLAICLTELFCLEEYPKSGPNWADLWMVIIQHDSY